MYEEHKKDLVIEDLKRKLERGGEVEEEDEEIPETSENEILGYIEQDDDNVYSQYFYLIRI